MCSFLVANLLISNLTYVNFFLHPRGPDATTHTRIKGYDFVHNLLHMTGEPVPQPFVHGRIVATYNGEIYNWRALGQEIGGTGFRSDGDAILPAYEKFGVDFVRLLQGEYGIAVFDFAKDIAILATDAFGTKPLWYSLNADKGIFAVSTYKTGLMRLGIDRGSIRMVGPNKILNVQLSTFELVRQAYNFEFDIRQWKTNTADFINAFKVAIERRTDDLVATKRSFFIGLSSGFDSGVIHAALHQQGIKHHAFALIGSELKEMLISRAVYAAETSEVAVVAMSQRDFDAERQWLSERAEPGGYLGVEYTGQESVLGDQASVGLSYIVRLGRDQGALCYLSGSGADEILSDYGFDGTKFCPQSVFGGLFPDSLNEIFPWATFFLSTQRDYLIKEEHVAGAHGVEARFPFLDPMLVQEFLWLHPDVKNSEYKVGLHDAFVQWEYPFERRTKRGFAAEANLLEARSRVWRYQPYRSGKCGLPPVTPAAVSKCVFNDEFDESAMQCTMQCSSGQSPIADSLRCNSYGAWVGRIVCENGHGNTIQEPLAIWGGTGPAHPPD